MGIVPASWRLSRLSWVSGSMQWLGTTNSDWDAVDTGRESPSSCSFTLGGYLLTPSPCPELPALLQLQQQQGMLRYSCTSCIAMTCSYCCFPQTSLFYISQLCSSSSSCLPPFLPLRGKEALRPCLPKVSIQERSFVPFHVVGKGLFEFAVLLIFHTQVTHLSLLQNTEQCNLVSPFLQQPQLLPSIAQPTKALPVFSFFCLHPNAVHMLQSFPYPTHISNSPRSCGSGPSCSALLLSRVHAWLLLQRTRS